MVLARLEEEATREVKQQFGVAPKWIAAAPGRVNLIGEHVDYNDGFVLPMAIDRQVVIAAAPSEKPVANLFSTSTSETVAVSLEAPLRPEPGSWANYVRGVIAFAREEGLSFGGFDAVIHSDVPPGGGLSSSAALEVATATLLEAIAGRTLDPVEKALLARRAEHEFAGVPCGIMDQFASVLAQEDHALLLDCRSRTTRAVPLKDPSVSILIADTRARHNLAASAYAQRVKECAAAAEALGCKSLRDADLKALEAAASRMDPVAFRRARHVIGEIRRTQDAAGAAGRGDWETFGKLMVESHRSLREDYEVSCDELDAMVAAAGDAKGVLGSRMTGAGFGGCTVSLVRTDAVDAVIRRMIEGYARRTPLEPSFFATRPAGGACILRR
jgi:galactokinase